MLVPQEFAFDVEQRHAPALGEETLGHGEPDAARGAGHESDFLWSRGHACSIGFEGCVVSSTESSASLLCQPTQGAESREGQI